MPELTRTLKVLCVCDVGAKYAFCVGLVFVFEMGKFTRMLWDHQRHLCVADYTSESSYS